jgi:hypothetical protein
MKELTKSGLTIVGFLFAILLLAFTGVQTFSLILAITGSAIMAVVGLTMFEGGMLYWWQVFRAQAEGLLQMSLSLLVFLACLLFVVTATALKLGAVDAAILGVSTPAKLITAAAVIQLTAKLLFPLLHPDVVDAINERVREGKILDAASKKFDKRVDGIADDYTDMMVEEKTARMMTRFNTKYNTRYQLPGHVEPLVIEGQTATDATPRAPRPSWRDRVFGRNPAPAQDAPQDAQPAQDAHSVDAATVAAVLAAIQRGEIAVPVAMSNSTHATQPTAHPAPGQGQGGNVGNGAPGKMGVDTRNPTSRQ